MDREKMTRALKDATSNVMDRMFFQPVHFADSAHSLEEWFSHHRPLIGSSINFSGPLQGSLYLLMPAALATEITASFLGLEKDEISKEQEKDTLKEALNMVGGHMLSLVDKGGAFHLGLPELMEEMELSCDSGKEPKGETLFMQTENHRLAMGITISESKA
ncbi:MAG: hypothetical protein DRH11_10755 [Deltaproteobacteria bacterium]|nr:chemotaxis protein CheX [Deltaproteobacteria bacterium]RLB32774.1 MAG: hypothetical protein DRH11_10755 [Deltaproteobacteria bacterium]